MSALINALDNHTSKQIGENGHAEYGWSNSIRERILQFSFQLTRTDEKGLKNLSRILSDILNTLKVQQGSFVKNSSEHVVVSEYLIILYKMIGQTRDIIDGKGECLLTYMMIYTWFQFYPELALYAVKCLVDFGDDGKSHQYGSWKDIKYFSSYCHKNGCLLDHPLIQYAINIVNAQIKTDYANLVSNSDEISLAGKWVPREKSGRFGWMYEALACNYFPDYVQSASRTAENKRANSKAAAILKAKTEYRKLLSSLNKKIDTLQIKQCDKNWAEIDFKKVTSVSMSKQRKAFLNVTKKGEPRFPGDNDRVECAEHFNAHIQKAIKGEIEIKGKRLGLENFTKQAIELNKNHFSPSFAAEKALLDSQWRDNSSQTGALDNIIAMVDTSGSMSGDPLNAAIALGIRVAEKSKLGKRVMTFSSSPRWVNLEGQDDFTSMVKTLENAEWGMSTNFDAALNMILDAIIEAKMEPEDVEGLTLAIFSDMQMDSADGANRDTNVLYNRITTKYADAGLRVKGKPYKPPHILFWNLRSTSGFPVLSTQQNASMMSGFSAAMLNLFCEHGIESLQACSPWSLFLKGLENERYSIMEIKARNFFL
jgi:hypothetical protein